MELNPNLDLATRVVAWHNRAFFARRITPAMVQGIGVVALPFAQAGGATEPAAPAAMALPLAPAAGGTLRERAQALAGAEAPSDAAAAAVPAAAPAPFAVPTTAGWRAALAPLLAPRAWWRGLRRAKPVFSEDFIAPLSPRQVARFAGHHGVEQRPGAAGWPQRDVLIDIRRLPASGVQALTLYLRSATIEVGNRRLRLLVGVGPGAAVLGQRLWSRPRIGAAAGLVTLLFAAVALLPLLGGQAGDPTTPDLMARAQAPEPAASSVQDTQDALQATDEAASQPAATLAATEPAPLAAEPAASRPEAAPPLLAATEPAPADTADIRPRLSTEMRKAARFESNELRSTMAARRPPGPAPAEAAPPVPAETPPLPHASVRTATAPAARPGAPTDARTTTTIKPTSAAAMGNGPVFALAARATKGRAASEVLLAMLDGAVAGVARPGDPQRTELLQVGPAYRAVWWPFGSRADAELGRTYLATLGISVEVVEF